jgi:hypothetical protein
MSNTTSGAAVSGGLPVQVKREGPGTETSRGLLVCQLTKLRFGSVVTLTDGSDPRLSFRGPPKSDVSDLGSYDFAEVGNTRLRSAAREPGTYNHKTGVMGFGLAPAPRNDRRGIQS